MMYNVKETFLKEIRLFILCF